MKFLIRSFCLLLALGFGFSSSYMPTHYDTRMLEYATQDIIEWSRDAWSVEEKIDIGNKIESSLDDWLTGQLLWYAKSILSYREKKSSSANDTDDSAPEVLALEYVKVVEDGKWALNMRSWPSKNFDVVGKLPEWSRVKVTLEMNGWFEIDRTIDGKRAWILWEFVEKSESEDEDKDQNKDKNKNENEDENENENQDQGRDTENDSIPTVTEAKVEVVVPSVQNILKKVEVSPNDAGSLRVRNGATSESRVLWKLLVGDQVDVYEEKDGYFRIDWNDWEDYAWIAVEFVHLAGTEAPTWHISPSPPAPLPTTPTSLGEGGIRDFKQAFLDTYRPLVDSKDKELIGLCKEYYDEIDVIAREYDFPVELIIATWFREHTCKFKNPSNGRGNFQIITRHYQPWPITRAQFEQQVIDFIKFSEGKRKFYDQTQNFWPLPIELSYGSFDLLSIRKHAIYYNGIVSTPEQNVYANQNFNWIRVWWADGIVATFLKVLKYGLEKEG